MSWLRASQLANDALFERRCVHFAGFVSGSLGASRMADGTCIFIIMRRFALLACYCDPVALLLAGAVTIAHHLILNYTAPFDLYPSGASLTRIGVHYPLSMPLKRAP